MKLFVKLVGVVVMLAVLGVGGLWLVTSQTAVGQSLRDIASNQIQSAVNSRIVPELGWAEAEFERPGTLRLNGLFLRAPDGTSIVEVARAEIELVDVPRPNRPITIRRVTLAEGEVRLIADGEGGFVGLTPFVRGSGDATPEPEPETEVDSEPVDITEILDLRKLEIQNIDLVYDDGHAAEPMRVPGFSLALDVRPVDDVDADTTPDAPAPDAVAAGVEPGPMRPANETEAEAPTGPAWYEMAFEAGRKPGLELDVNGRFNLNTYAVWLDGTTAYVDIDDDTLGTLPGQVRNLLEQYGVRGELSVTLAGLVTPLSIAESDAEVTITGSGLNVEVGEYRFPLDHLAIHADLDEGVAELDELRIDAVGGKLTVSGSYPVTGSGPASAVWSVETFDLQRFLASHSAADGPPKIAGLFTMHGEANTDAGDPVGHCRVVLV